MSEVIRFVVPRRPTDIEVRMDVTKMLETKK